jgi:hypothetical protein
MLITLLLDKWANIGIGRKGELADWQMGSRKLGPTHATCALVPVKDTGLLDSHQTGVIAMGCAFLLFPSLASAGIPHYPKY